MGQLFQPGHTTILKAMIFTMIFGALGFAWAAASWTNSSWATNQGRYVSQSVPFSHEHHVRGLGIDCRFCHTGVETSAYAGLPSTKTCMTCHSQIWRDAPMLKPVRDSWSSQQPMQWNRVHNLPGYVFFNHSAHIQKGVGCSSCHGNVALMPLTFQSASLQMKWCLDCHRNPEMFLRPRDQVFNMAYQAPPDQAALGAKLAERYGVMAKQMMQTCSLCHR